ncbi:TlpA family protein disulfide reductase [Sporosarcina sp. CAU 1771]
MKKSLFVLSLLLLLSACSSSSDKTDNMTSSDNQAPTFELEDTNGTMHNLEDYAGKKVYIKFWATWCPICLSGLEEINMLAEEDTDFVVLTIVSPDYNNEKNKEDFIKWISGVENVDALPVLLDEGGTVAKSYSVRGYPTSAFIDENGGLIKTQPGHLSNEQIKDVLK